MIMGSSLRAQAAGTSIINNTSASAVSVTTASALDFIYIENSTVKGNVTNSGTIDTSGGARTVGIEITTNSLVEGGVTNNASATISASQIGIYVHDSSLITDGITNAGDINVVNTGTGIQTTPVAGIWVSSAADTSLDNSGSINVTASRTGGGTALAFAGGVGFVNGTGDVSITNSGDISVLAKASDAPIALAGALGIVETASSSGTALDIDLSNTSSGTISIGAQATASGFAAAGVLGIFQGAYGANNVAVDLTNDGTIDIYASASATGTTANAFAIVGYGVIQSASAGGTAGDTAAVTLTNTSDLSLNILANATASGTSANATALIGYAIDQHALNADDVSASFDNSGTVNIAAQAIAYGVTAAHAVASVGVSVTSVGITGISWTSGPVVYQSASSLGNSGSIASVGLTNDGTFSIAASAFASAISGTASASAYNYWAISQHAHSAEDSSATFTNNGVLNITALAQATASSTAYAYASISDAIYQHASGNGGDDSIASVALTNSADGEINILAYATGGVTTVSGNPAAAGTSSAYISAIISRAIYQNADNADQAILSVTNDGTINILASADANGTGSAYAYAYVGSGVDQHATASNNETLAEVTYTNSGPLNIGAYADASATTGLAEASAWVTYGVHQYASAGAETTAELTNNSDMSIVAQAKATAANTATAYAYLTNAIVQTATGNATDGSVASATFTNSTDATLNIRAYATASGSDASAIASINSSSSNAAIYQEANGADTASVAFSNSGTINIISKAVANGTTYSADAYANNDTAIWQYVDADNNELSATATLTNDGPLTIKAQATASQTISSSAQATADLHYAIFQEANDGLITSVGLTNNSTLNIIAQAKALSLGTNASSHTASAFAYVDDAIVQLATANSVDGAVASATFTNSTDATLNILAYATASGTDASAGAYINSTGSYAAIYQEATGADEASVSFSNSGTINIISKAIANGTTYSADAYASNVSAVWQTVDADNNELIAIAMLTNNGPLNIMAQATASQATSSSAQATAYIEDAIWQEAADGASTTVSLTNNSTMNIIAQAKAISPATATANAYVSDGIVQIATGNAVDGSVASATFSNSTDATLNILAYATASGTDASANAYINSSSSNAAIYQEANGADTASVTFSNSGTINIISKAIANGTTYNADAYADNDTAIWQYVDADNNELSATATLTNDGPLNIQALAYAATQSDSATATADLDYAIYQEAKDGLITSVGLTNNSTLNIVAVASAIVSGSSGSAYADATIDQAIYQSADGDGSSGTAVNSGNSATASITNNASLTLSADADAIAGNTATAFATITSGIVQYAIDADTVQASFNNTGALLVAADAYAEAFDASAKAVATALRQNVQANAGGDATASFVNSSSFEVSALAVALGQHNSQTVTSATATAVASARGVRQDILTGGETTATMAFDNSGSFIVMATASAAATIGTAANNSSATAYARGYHVFAGTEGYTANLDVTNSGDMYIQARAILGGTDTAVASARGIIFNAETLTGSFVNSGNLTVIASASGGTATARGLDIRADNVGKDTASFANSGTISVTAIASSASAIAVRFMNYTYTGTGAGTATASFTNDGGTISATVDNNGSLDDGYDYGYAFYTEDANYPVLLNWQGSSADGSIFGHVEIKDGDMIYVTSGTTRFDGAINPTTDDNVGELDIYDDGKLILALNQDIKGSVGLNTSYVDSFTVQSDGTIGYEIEAESGDISRIDAITASLDGTIMVTALAGLYSGTWTYQDVIDADTLTGTFANETTQTPLLDLAVTYDSDDNVDLTVTRVAFNAVSGLTVNQKAVAAGIETTYSTLLANSATYADYTDLVGELFTLDETEYPDALDQLSGVEYAGALQAATGSFRYFHNAVEDRVKAAHDEGTSTSAFINTLFSGTQNGKADSGAWASVQGGSSDQDGDGNASGYSYDQVSALIGADGMVNDRLMVGIAGGIYSPGDLDFDNGNTVSQETGYQIGAYAQYDTGQYYARGFVGYGAWDASATRTISIGTLSGTNTSSFDVSAWNVSGEGGYDFKRTNFTLTPYAGLSYTYASLGNYVESGFAASALSGDGSADQLDGYVGVRVSGINYKTGNTTIMPEFAFGYIYNFSDEASVNNTLIAAPTGTSFTILGPEHGGAAFLNHTLSVYVRKNVKMSIGYAGEYGSDHQDHSGFGQLKVNF
jgi:uncharacterized protein with beta-barrel porin domain